MNLKWYQILLCLAVPFNYFYWLVLHKFFMMGLIWIRQGKE